MSSVTVNGHTVVAPSNRKSRRSKEERELQVRDQNLENVKGDKVPFTFCRRLSKTPKNKIKEYDAIDRCASCNEPVVYDRRHSEGAKHYCMLCVGSVAGVQLQRSILGDALTSDVDLYKQMMDKNKSQNRHNETLIKRSHIEIPGRTQK